jgi:NAD dependent epimerase/dehydratase family enzyme
VGLAAWGLSTGTVSGPLNLTAPEPVTNAEFSRTLGRVLHRPAVMPAPAFAMRLALGEMADALLLTGQRVVPARAQALGYRFQFATLEPALRDIYRD